MVRIVVFDSGFGSLSVIRPIQKKIKSEIIYFADQKNYPYGLKSKSELRKIIKDTISFLDEKFNPDLIIVGSNTPSILVNELISANVLGVYPPLKEAKKISRTKNIAVLATKNVSKSKELEKYIKKNISNEKFSIYKINASKLVDLVESGKFLTNTRYCYKVIEKELCILGKEDIDTATLSSTHLPFLRKFLEEQFPNVSFLDPAEKLAYDISKMKFNESKRNSLKIFSSGIPKKFENQLKKLEVRTKVSFLAS